MNRRQRFGSAIRYYISIPIALICFILLAYILAKEYYSIFTPILGATIGALVAIFFLHVWSTQREQVHSSPPDYRFAMIVTGIYISSMIWMYRLSLYQRPVVHYFAFGGFAAYIAYEIGVGANRTRIIPQLVALTFFTYWSVQFAFPEGMFAPDTRGKFIPTVRTALDSGFIHDISMLKYLSHLTYVVETTAIAGVSAKLGYFLISTFVVLVTIFIISIMGDVMPSVSHQVALYGALFFSCMSWTLKSAFYPNKLNFFYALILVVGYAAIIKFGSQSATTKRRWVVIGFIGALAIIFGHRFSAGVALVLLLTISLFVFFSPRVINYKERLSFRHVFYFVSAYILAIVGTPLHQGALLRRMTDIVSSVVTGLFPRASSGAASGGSPGRYSALPLEELIISTSSQAIFFALAVFGAAYAVRRKDWEYDLVLAWIGAVSLLLFIGLMFNQSSVQPQRFYAYLGLFGLNICAGVGIVNILRSDIDIFSARTVSIIVLIFTVLSLGSPVAGIHFSFIGDDIPHTQKYNIQHQMSGEKWVHTYQGPQSIDMWYELPRSENSNTSAKIDLSRIDRESRYMYSQEAQRTGVTISGGTGLGDRRKVFLEFIPSPIDNKIYTNAETVAYTRRGE